MAGPRREGDRLGEPDHISALDKTALDDLTIQSGAMFQKVADCLLGDHVDVATGVIQSTTFQDNLANSELSTHKVVERHIPGRKVAPVFVRIETDFMVPGQCLQRFDLNKGHFTHIWLGGVGA